MCIRDSNLPPPNPNQPQIFNAFDGQNLYYQGGTGDDTFIAGTGRDNFEGGGGADVFVFTLGEGSSNANLMTAAMGADGILDFDRVDGDKLRILSEEGEAIDTPFGDNMISSDNSSVPNYTLVRVNGTNEVVFGINGTETFTDADVIV